MASSKDDKIGNISSQERNIRKWIKAAKARVGVMQDMLDAYGGLLAMRVKVREELAGLDLTIPDPAKDKLGRGLPLLVGEELGMLAKGFDLAALRMAPAVAEAFPVLADEAKKVGDACESGRLSAADLAETLLTGDVAKLEGMAETADVRQEALVFVAGEIVNPVLQQVASALAERISETGWLRGQCPVCGQLPDVAVFRPLNDDNEYLKNYGGQRWLHCPRCATQWRFRRHVCPHCANEDNDTLAYYAGAEQGERADVCRKCGRYMVGLDVREFIDEPNLDVAALAMLPLDILVQREGFVPLADTVWNRLG